MPSSLCGRAWLFALLLAALQRSRALVAPLQRRSPRILLRASGADADHSALSRRETLAKGFGVPLGALVLSSCGGSAASATVFLDPDRYGDKELKIATVASMKQQLRNSILQNPQLASSFLELAVVDALSYDEQTGKGGLDGSVALSIYQSGGEDRLKDAVKAILQVKSKLQKTKEVTLADLIAFAGAEAIESTGGPVSQVQIGRYDAKPDKATGTDFPSDPVAAFKRAGLGAREAALLIGAAGEIALATRDAKGDQMMDEEDEEDEENPDDYVPTTFGAPSEIYGKQVSKSFGIKYVEALSKGQKGGKISSDWEASMLKDEELQRWVTRYAEKKSSFRKDLAEAYQKLTLLGTEGTTRNTK